MPQHTAIQRLLHSRVFFALLLLLTVVSALRLTNEIVRRSKITAEIEQLRTEINRLEGERNELSSLIEYLHTDAYIEEEARRSLNLARPGERVVVVQTDEDTEDQDALRSNRQKWFAYFFEVSL